MGSTNGFSSEEGRTRSPLADPSGCRSEKGLLQEEDGEVGSSEMKEAPSLNCCAHQSVRTRSATDRSADLRAAD